MSNTMPAITPMPIPTVVPATQGLSIPLTGTQTRGAFTASHFASTDELSRWFPKVRERQGLRHFGISFSSRSRVLLAQVALIFTVLGCNIALTVFAVSTYQSDDTVGVIYEGDCDTVGDLNLWLHLLINGLSMGMLSGKQIHSEFYFSA